MISSAMDPTELTYRKIDARLRIYGVRRMAARHRIASELIAQAGNSSGPDDLERRAGQVFDKRVARMSESIRQAAGLPDTAEGISRSLLLMGILDPELIWTADLSAPEVRQKIRAQTGHELIVTGPELTRSALGAPKINFGSIQDTTESTLAALNQLPKLRLAGYALLLVGLAFFIFTTAR